MSAPIHLGAGELTAWLGHWWWPFVRISACLWMMPVFGDPRVSAPIRLLFAFLLSLLLAPLLKAMPALDPFSLGALVLAVEQILFGLLLGFCLQLLFMAMSLLGQILAMQMGLAMAVMNDPQHGDSSPVVSQLMLLFATLLFLGLDGHLVALEVLVESLRRWPPGAGLYQLDLTQVLALFGWVFGAALTLSLPAVVAMLLVNLTFGAISRSAPSLNVFSLGFPMTLMLGLLVLRYSIEGIPGLYLQLAREVLGQMRALSG